MEILNISAKKRKGFDSRTASKLRKKRKLDVNSLSYGPELRNPRVVSLVKAGRIDIKQQ